MKNNNYTKGEWHLESVNGIKFIQDKDNRYLATVHGLENGKNNDEKRKESEANAKLIVKAVNNHDKLIEALKAFHEMFVHKEGESKKNKVKTNMIKYCDEVKNALNNSRELLQSIEQQ